MSVKISDEMPVKAGEVLCNHLKEKLARGEVAASMTVRLVHGIEIARIAKTAGFDSLYVDMEHSSFSFQCWSPAPSAISLISVRRSNRRARCSHHGYSAVRER
jgi:hypothetical protein